MFHRCMIYFPSHLVNFLRILACLCTSFECKDINYVSMMLPNSGWSVVYKNVKEGILQP